MINKNFFTNGVTWPYEFIKYIQETLALNQKATDVVHLTGIVSIDIDKDDHGDDKEIDSIKVDDGAILISSIAQYGYMIEMVAYEYDQVEDQRVEFYNSYLQPITDYNFNPTYDTNEAVLTMRSTVEGCRYKLSRIDCIDVSSSYSGYYALKAVISTNKTHYVKYLTKNMVIKLFEVGSEERDFYLFKQTKDGYFEQCAGPVNGDGSFAHNIEIIIDKTIPEHDDEDQSHPSIIFKCITEFFDNNKDYQVTFTSEKEETKLYAVTFNVLYNNGQQNQKSEITDIHSYPHEEHSIANLPQNTDIMFIISRHEGVTT